MYRVPLVFLCAIAGLLLLLPVHVATASGDRAALNFTPPEVGQPVSDLSLFLNRLTLAESGGRATAANPRSSALGPFQFIKSTFLDLVRRRFAGEIAGLTDEQLLGLRTDPVFSRRVAEAYTLENAAFLQDQGIAPTLPRLRLAFLLGAPGATRVLKTQPQTRLSEVLGPGVLRANPFMIGMTAMHLIQKAVRDIWGGPRRTLDRPEPRLRTAVIRPASRSRPAPQARPGTPSTKIVVRCNEHLASCKRWIALQVQKAERTRDAQSREPAKATGSKHKKV